MLLGCQHQAHLYRDNRVLMGTVVEVVTPYPEAANIVFDEIRRLESLFDIHRPSSEVSRLNRFGRLENAKADTVDIIKQAKEFYAISAGAFDVTSARLSALWRRYAGVSRLPSKARISEQMRFTGSDKILLNEDDYVIEFKAPGVEIDLGAIAKGWALDRAAQRLKNQGITDCLINAGGQVYALGKCRGQPWKVGMLDFQAVGESIIIDLQDASASTSGDSERSFVINGVAYSHILDPRTGYPAKAGLSSVTVVAASAAAADALSTIVFILGIDEGRRIVEKFPGARIAHFTKQAGDGRLPEKQKF